MNTKYDILAKMLTAAKAGASKYRVMTSCSTNWPLFMRHLSLLVEQGLIEERGELFYTTPKGRQYLSAYGEICTSIGMAEIIA